MTPHRRRQNFHGAGRRRDIREKNTKPCLNCSLSKVRCVVLPDSPGQCQRCTRQGRDCPEHVPYERRSPLIIQFRQELRRSRFSLPVHIAEIDVSQRSRYRVDGFTPSSGTSLPVSAPTMYDYADIDRLGRPSASPIGQHFPQQQQIMTSIDHQSPSDSDDDIDPELLQYVRFDPPTMRNGSE